MSAEGIAERWAEEFGLAEAPLFEVGEVSAPERHHVLLDGGQGSFAISEGDKDADAQGADWAWSSNLPHHVGIHSDRIVVTRWDSSRPEVLSRSSVEARLDAFYDYLLRDRVRSTRRVVEHAVDLFRRVRSLVADAKAEDAATVDAFLAILDLADERSLRERGTQTRASVLLADARASALQPLASESVDALVAEALRSSSRPGQRWLPSLAVRHAGAEVFQDAHFELLHTSGPDLFGLPGPSEVQVVTRGGVHYTPPALARSITEETLREVEGVATRPVLTIADLACGSGAFLHEALRALRRTGFAGHLTIVGRDISRPAVAMARYVIEHALRDWRPAGGADVDLREGNSLADDLPRADVVVMNPPFIAWAAMDDVQRDQVREVLGPRLKGRADYSMAFVTRALGQLHPGGAVGTLLPASLLSLQAAEAWREDLAGNSSVRLLASLGDYGLFAHALVQVAALVIAPGKPDGEPATGLVAANDPIATGEALRGLRRSRRAGTPPMVTEDAWRLFAFNSRALKGRSNWRFIPPAAQEALNRAWDGGAVRLDEVFEVKQGIRTGLNSAFILDADQLRMLPIKERSYFKPAVMNDSLEAGRLLKKHWLFYPHRPGKALFSDQDDLMRAVPTYASRFLLPNQGALASRSSIMRGERKDWWGLAEPRNTWALRAVPRLVSKYFGGVGSFACDLDNTFVIVQGFGWLPRWIEPRVGEEDGEEHLVLGNEDSLLLSAYGALLNSPLFGRLLELHSAHVAGGQHDLSPRYVNEIPLPRLADLLVDERLGAAVTKLADLGADPRPFDSRWATEVAHLASVVYGGLDVANL